ncbi:MAG TPA: hypothetical protein DDX39_01630 [Bacteroidales bacterium]|nr:MAG: hypothetical protein A2W98_07845 [Bacteroidetes bacterium GWF2_33_38]OFY74637.1 MAG: hypothetical protein A2265_01470 [Bacteroidetes bacterium RIFOXYA12_FULL_33_9]OFY92252.1 MAG: hypothetical protein A2236_09100 [Bacteroidetes bacterium RIFOXYA2_FULL_33_7]HBF87312.1 hypothetical protein [Bacteroidales bacterium]
MNITLTEKHIKNKLVASIAFDGNLVLSECNRAKEQLQSTIQKYKAFQISLEKAESIDLSFVQLLISFFETIVHDKKEIKMLKILNPNIKNILETTGFINQIEKYTES